MVQNMGGLLRLTNSLEGTGLVATIRLQQAAAQPQTGSRRNGRSRKADPQA